MIAETIHSVPRLKNANQWLNTMQQPWAVWVHNASTDQPTLGAWLQARLELIRTDNGFYFCVCRPSSIWAPHQRTIAGQSVYLLSSIKFLLFAKPIALLGETSAYPLLCLDTSRSLDSHGQA